MTNVELYPEKPLRGRRLTWREFTKLTGRPRPDYAAMAANDNIRETEAPHALLKLCVSS